MDGTSGGLRFDKQFSRRRGLAFDMYWEGELLKEGEEDEMSRYMGRNDGRKMPDRYHCDVTNAASCHHCVRPAWTRRESGREGPGRPAARPRLSRPPSPMRAPPTRRRQRSTPAPAVAMAIPCTALARPRFTRVLTAVVFADVTRGTGTGR